MLPTEIVQKIKEYMPRDKDRFSPTAKCMRLAIYKYDEHKFWNYHAWLLSFHEFALSDWLKIAPYQFQYLADHIPTPNERREWGLRSSD